MWQARSRVKCILHQGVTICLLMGSLITACNPTIATTKPTAGITNTPEITAAIVDTATPEPLPTPIGVRQTPSAIPSATIPVELGKLKGTRIRIIHPWTGQAGREFRQLINEFNQENVWQIQVEEVQSGSVSEISQIFTESLASSDHVDIAATSPEYLADWYGQGRIIDLADFISNPEWGITDAVRDTYYASVWKANQVDEKLIAIPAQINLQFMVYNQTWAEELGFTEIPTTRQEFIRQVCEAAIVNNKDAKKENDGTGGWIINTSSTTLISWINAFGGNKTWLQDPLEIITQNETGDAFSFLREMMEKGCAWNSRVASPFTYFAERQTLAFSASLPDLIELEETLSFTKNSDKWTILPYPGAEKYAPALMTGMSYGISQTEPVEELASWLFVRWLALPRNQARLSEAAGTIPPTTAGVNLMETTGEVPVWWKEAITLVADASILPASSDLRRIRPVLEDGFWQMMQPTPMAIPTLMNQMNDTIKAEQ
ncbi:MAG: extracellular solute-binding protein [Leptolinea sp.]|jgi:multiple sugar transport system substrate-binding protein|nr:extracellular solute-binding protein [Leptolinea sp.]